jgi:hypothetical protein
LKFCETHWETLRRVIRERGLEHLVSQSGQEIGAKVAREIERKSKTFDFDPLMAAHNMIAANALRCGGLYLLAGDYCPLCELDKADVQQDAEDWIRFAADGALRVAMENGLQG